MTFQNRIIWITGASSGIGEALAYAFWREGATLVLSARRLNELERVKRTCLQIQKGGEKDNKNAIVLVPLDLAASETLPAIAYDVLQRLGHIDILVNNGGVAQRSLAKDTAMAVDRSIMEVNFFGTVALTKALLPSMLERKAGHIVVVSSVVGKLGTPVRSAYSASKHALHGFFDSLRAEVWRENIAVTIVCPGYIRTAISLNAFVGDGSKQNTMDNAQAKGMSAEECARKILKAVAQGKEEVAMGGKEIWGIYLKRFVPRLFSKIIRRVKVT